MSTDQPTEHANHPAQSRVLVVDDERVIADTLTAILRISGFEARATYSGEEAIRVAREFRPDILLADYAMPGGMDGLQAAMEIGRTFPGCRVIMLSGQPLNDEFAPYRSKGFNFLLLSKPMHPQDLVRTIRSEGHPGIASAVRPRILNVDDVEEHRYSISRLLARAGFDVSQAATGADAIRQAIELQPELVLLDIHLPDYSGYDVCKALKEHPDTARIAVVHITASDHSEEGARRSANAGADEYLTYPIVPQRLIHRLRELLQIRYLNQPD